MFESKRSLSDVLPIQPKGAPTGAPLVDDIEKPEVRPQTGPDIGLSEPQMPGFNVPVWTGPVLVRTQPRKPGFKATG